MILDLHLIPSDWTLLQQVILQRIRVRAGRARLGAAVVVPMAAAVVVVSGLAPDAGVFLAFCIGVLSITCGSVLSHQLLRRHLVPDAEGHILGPFRMELLPEGMRTTGKGSNSLTQWSAFKGITHTDTHVFLWVDAIAAHIVPLRDVPQGAEVLLSTVLALAGPLPCERADSGGHPRPEPANRDAPAQNSPGDAKVPPPGFIATLVRRVAWREVPLEGPEVVSGDAMVLAGTCLVLATWLGYDRYAAGPGAEWYPSGATSLAWYAMGVLGLAWVFHRALLGSAPSRAVLAALVTSIPLPLAVGLAIQRWAPESWQVVLYVLLAAASFLQLARLLTPPGGRGPLLAGSLFVFLFALATKAAWVQPHFWFAAERGEAGNNGWRDSERLLFAQADRIDAAAARMTPPRDRRPDLFFVGFAGVAEQKVFAEELTLTEHVVTERYGAVGRSLLLVNDHRDHDLWPIATVLGLRRALARVGERMNREEDVLFLMLTSHGSDAPSLSVSNGTWPLEQLDGRALRGALDESGIRWRVIVISACHSGAFIEPLADDHTIVLTAAAKTKTSFGCSDDADLTYFGQALMRDALPRADSLESAFEQAKQIVAERERRQALGTSEPQAYFGNAIRPYWKEIEAARPRGGDGGAVAIPR